MSSIDPPYTYRARIVRWVDGDTVDLDIDLGFHVTVRERCRLASIDTPERGAPGWAEATVFARSLAPEGSTVLINSMAPLDKYGRYLVAITLPNGYELNLALILNGHARPYTGGKR